MRLSELASGGLALLVVGSPAERASAFLKAVASRRSRCPSLLLSPYPGFTRLLAEASRALGAEGLLERVLVSTVPAEASRLASLVSLLSPALLDGLLSVVGFDSLFSNALKECGRDVDSRSRLISSLSVLRALARRGGVCVLVMEASPPPCVVARQVDGAWASLADEPSGLTDSLGASATA
ncbi:MAG: hypothetical protein N3H31_03740 [Candidatus Nezhaarchaeota archaeon]|nr:hypothetical protein [Candidatus Nezhaarchaeota archaeon]